MEAAAAERRVRRRIQKIREDMCDVEEIEKDLSSIEIEASETDDHAFSDVQFMSDNVAVDVDDNDDEESDNQSLTSDLRSWINKHRPSREAANDLLRILLSNGLNVPKDSRTLMKTPRQVATLEKCGGTYNYVGIKKGILVASEHLDLVGIECIELSINIDGVPLSKSSNSQLWPILGSINGSSFVFIIAMFHASSKPNSVHEYLQDFITESKQLIESGIEINSTMYQFSIKCFICDCPARSFLKCTIGHNGIHACERCDIKGRSVQHRTVFNSATYQENSRTDDMFKTGAYLNGHQKSISPLVELGIDCIHQFTLDYMHLVLLGVMKRILGYLTKGPNTCKLSQQLVSQISARLLIHNGLMPSEFNRQPRSLAELCYWKSTELRQFLLYHGPVVLKGIVSNLIYNHFLALHVATILLLKSKPKVNEVQFAKELLIWFVKNSETVYGCTFNVYNVHSLIHLADDVLHFNSSLDDLSAFKFENFMQTVKKSVRASTNPVAQVVKRMAESNGNFNSRSKENFLKIKEFGKDSCFLTDGGEICFIENIYDSTVACRILSKGIAEDFFTSPVHSRELNIIYIRNFGSCVPKRKTLEKHCLVHKMVKLPFKDGFVFFPLLHCFSANQY